MRTFENLCSDWPASIVFDIDSKSDMIIKDVRNQTQMVESVILITINTLIKIGIDCQFIKFKTSESSRENKFSVHLVSNYYYEPWEIQFKFISICFAEQIEAGLIYGEIYLAGGRNMCIIGSTKFGLNSFLTRIESDKSKNTKILIY